MYSYAKSNFLKGFLCILAILLHGCSNRITTLETQGLSPQHLTNWQIKAKVSGFDEKNNWRCTMDWQQSLQNVSINLRPQMSSKQISLQANGNKASITLDGKYHEGENLDMLLQRHTGWNVPFKSLEYWIKGLPNPNKPHQIHKNGSIQKIIRQDNWVIEYKKFTNVKSYLLPKLITLENHPHKIRIFIEQWCN